MSRVTRSGAKLDDEESGTRRRSSFGVKESMTPLKKSNVNVPMVSSPGVRRSSRVLTPSKILSGAGPYSSEKFKKRDSTNPQIASAAGIKRKLIDDEKDSSLPPSKRKSGSDEKQTTYNSPLTRSGNRRDKNVKKLKVHEGSNSKKLKKKKIKKKSKKKKKSRTVSSLVSKIVEGGKTSKVGSGDSTRGEEEERKSVGETPSSSKKEELKVVGETPRASKKEKGNTIDEGPKSSNKDESKVSGEASTSKTSSHKLSSGSRRLDLRSYKKLFTSQKDSEIIDQTQEHRQRHSSSSHDDIDGCRVANEGDYDDHETVSSQPSLNRMNVGNEDNVDEDGFVEGVEESLDKRSSKTAEKCNCVREDDLGGNVEKSGMPQDHPHTIETDHRSMLERHHLNAGPHYEVQASFKSLSPKENQLPHIDVKSGERHKVDCEMLLPCENGEVQSVDAMQSAEKDPKQEDVQLVLEIKRQSSTLEIPSHDPVTVGESKRVRWSVRSGSHDADSDVERFESPKKKSRTGDLAVTIQDRKSLHGIDESDTLNYSQPKGSKPDGGDHSKRNACGICKLGGKLLWCDGKDCTQAYHLSCLKPPLEDVPPGIWHCLSCVQKKLKFGPHSVSGGVESIWDVRCSEISSTKGCNLMEDKVEKEYLVKYRGLAHIHNRWIPENELLADAPKLLAKFKNKHQRNKVVKWNPDWTEPHRLLKRRLLMTQETAEDYSCSHGSAVPFCNAEWFVKWRGLGYEFATWELEDSSFFKCQKALMLMKDYDLRRQKAKHATRILNENPRGQDSSPSKFVNKLQEYWRDHCNAVVIDDQERTKRVILLISSLLPYVSRPFLIVSTSSALPAWESEMLAESAIDLVVYNGNKDVRDMIRVLEFYEEHGCVMFQVLLSTPDVVAEDIESFECIGWESIIVDECHSLRVSKHFEKIKRLNTDFRLLIFSGQIKDSIAEYLNILSFIDAMDNYNCISSSYDDNNNEELVMLKEKFLSKIAYKHESTSSKFREYWVPALLSDVQLEQYRNILVSNSIVLYAKSDPCDALLNILLLLKKCCDHPYLVDESLQSSLTKCVPETDFLDIGVRASGKLQLLDKILVEIKRRALRVLILFQLIGGSGPLSIGDILDDYLRQRFGADSYERVDSGLLASKKQSALNMFNDKERGCFVFLLENRACLPSIKLSSIDTIIIFDSDWDPSNDLKALHKISIDSQIEHPLVFRLYSPYTIEEKVLILSSKETVLDNNLKNVSPNIRHRLLMWGSAYLFEKLDELKSHIVPCTGSILSDERNLLEAVLQEMETLLPIATDTEYQCSNSVICKVIQNDSLYSKLTLLVGEARLELTNVDQPSLYWKKLLERFNLKHVEVQRQRRNTLDFKRSSNTPQGVPRDIKKLTKVGDSGKSVSSVSQMCSTGKTYRKVFASNGSASTTTVQPKNAFNGSPSTSKKCAKSVMGTDGPPTNQNGIESSSIIPRNDNVPEALNIDGFHSEDGGQAGVVQQSLHDCLKPQLLKLCGTLQFPKEVMDVAAISLEYVMKNHQVPREPESILQAFQMSLCWTAASMLKHEINHKASIVLVKQHLHFTCTKAEVKSVYKKLLLLRPYLRREISSRAVPLVALSESSSVDQNETDNHAHAHENSAVHEEVEELVGEITYDMTIEQQLGSKDQVHVSRSEKVGADVKQQSAFPHGDGTGQNETTVRVPSSLLSTKKKRLRYILQKQKEVLFDFKEFGDMAASKMTEEYEKHHANVLKEYQDDSSVLAEKLKVLRQDFVDRRARLRERMKIYQRFLLDRHKELQEREDNTYSYWLGEANAGRQVGPYFTLPLPDIPFQKDLLIEVQKLADEAPQSIPQQDSSKGIISLPSLNPLEDDQSMSCELDSDNGWFSNVLETLSAQGTNDRVIDSGLVLDQQNVSVDQGEQQNVSVGQVVIETSPTGFANATSTEQNEQAHAAIMSMESAMLAEPTGITVMDPVPTVLTGFLCKVANEMAPNIETSLANHGMSSSRLIFRNQNASTDGRSSDLGFVSPSSLIEQNEQVDAATKSMEPDIHAEPNRDTAMNQVPNVLSSIFGAETLTGVEEHSVADNPLWQETSSSQIADGRCPELSHNQNKQVDPPLESMEPAIHAEPNCDAAMDQVDNVLSGTLGAETLSSVQEHALADDPLLQQIRSSQIGDRQCPELSPNQVCSTEAAREPEDGFTGSEILPQARVSTPKAVDLSPSSAEKVLHVSCTDPLEWSAFVEVSRERDHVVAGVDFLPHDRVPEQQPLNAFNSSAQQVVQHLPISDSSMQPQLLPSLVVNEPAPLQNLRYISTTMEPVLQSGQTAPSTSRSTPMNYGDPLYHEILRLRKEDEQKRKLYEEEKLHLTAQCDKEIEEIKRKYAMLLQDLDARQLSSQKDIEDNINKVVLNRFLADTFRLLMFNPRILHSGISSTQALVQQSGTIPQVSVAHRPEGIPTEYRFGPLPLNLQASLANLNLRGPIIPPNGVPSQPLLVEPVLPRSSPQMEASPRVPMAFPFPRARTGSTVPSVGLPPDFSNSYATGAVQPAGTTNRIFESPPAPVSDGVSVRMTVKPLSSSSRNEGVVNPEVVYLSDDD